MNIWKCVRTLPMVDERYCIFFERLFEEDWGYMSMRDYRTYEPTDKFRITIADYDSSGTARNTDHGAIDVRDLDIDFVNKIWYNLKHKSFTKNALLQALKAEGKNLVNAWGEEVYV